MTANDKVSRTSPLLVPPRTEADALQASHLASYLIFVGVNRVVFKAILGSN